MERLKRTSTGAEPATESLTGSALRRLAGAAALAATVAAIAIPLQGSTAWQLGDLFVAIGNGNYQVRSNAGALKETLTAGGSGDTAGCAVDASLNVYLVNTTQHKIFKRALASPHAILQTIDTADPSPQSIVFAGNGDAFVGHLGGLIRRYVPNPMTGNLLPQESYLVTNVETTNSFWLDLSPAERVPVQGGVAERHTIFYTSGGRKIFKVTVQVDPMGNATFSADGEFATLPGPFNSNSNGAAGLRLLPPPAGAGNNAIIGGLVVADKSNIRFVNASGQVSNQLVYDASDTNPTQHQNDWFTVALDPKDVDEAGADRAFWAGDRTTGKLWRFNIQSKNIESGPFATGATGSLRGICLNGEPTTGQYSVILNLDPAQANPNTGEVTETATFARGTPAVEEHFFSITVDASSLPTGGRKAVVNAREAISDGVCTSGNPADTSDVDCGFKTYFSFNPAPFPGSGDPQQPIGAAYAHGRSAYYHVKWLTGNPQVIVTISSATDFSSVAAAAGTCTHPLTSLITGRAVRIFRDPSSTTEDQFAEDLLEAFFINNWGGKTLTTTNRFMAAFRCSQGFSELVKPANNRTFKAGNSVPVELKLYDALGNPITTALTPPHTIIVTIGSAGQVITVLGTPGNSPDFFNQTSDGTYKSNLSTTGLVASDNPYNLCVSDRIDPPDPNELPLYPQQCVTFFLK